MPLTISSSNPNYFQDSSGEPVVLVGSHTWNNLQNEGSTPAPASLDYSGYVNWMQSNDFNFMRLWNIGEQPYSAAWTTSPWYTDPLPYARTGPGLAADGKPKFDLNTFNQDYFDRLRDRVIEAGQHGIYADVMLFEGWSLDAKGGSTNPWTYHPFNINNNINGINGDPFNTGNGDTIQTTSEPAAARAVQQAYVRKVIDTVGDLDNALFEISNESQPNSTQWQYDMINYIKSYESDKPKQHPVGMTENNAGDAVLFNSPADWISPNYGDTYRSNQPANTGAKVVLNDTDHLWGAGGDANWVWESFTRGLNPVFMDDLGQTGINLGGRTAFFDPSYYTVRTGMTEVSRISRKLDLADDKPHGELTSTGYMLANPGNEYLAYAPSGGNVTVDLSTGPGSTFTTEWLNVATGATVTGAAIPGGSSAETFTAPFGGSAALLLKKSVVTVPGTGHDGSGTGTVGGSTGPGTVEDGMNVLSVGVGKTYSTIASAVAAAQNGDTINVDAGTYTNDYTFVNKDITLQGVGGMVKLVSTGVIPNGKAIFITSGDITINNFEFSGAAVYDGNGAGIRFEGGNLTLNNTYFHDNEEGLLAGTWPNSTITINNSEFGFNGSGDGQTHNLYVNRIENLTIDNSYFHDVSQGHEIKSRALNTTITNSRVYDLNGDGSYSIDLPNGGNAVIQNNVIEQGPNSPNWTIIAYGEEGNLNPGTSFKVSGNTILNDVSGAGLAVWNRTATTTAELSDNKFFGLTPDQIASGPNTQSGDQFLATEPVLDTSPPWSSAGTPEPPPTGADTTPTNTTIGSGPDSLVLQISQDQYLGPATYTIMVDGAQIGGVLTAHAEHDNPVQDVVTVNGDWGVGSHTVQVQMLEDAWGGLPSLDRNLYVESTTYNGAEVPGGSLFLNTTYAQTFAFTDGGTVDLPGADITPTNTTIGSGPDSVVLQISQDQYQGPATYTIMVDGAQIGGVLTAHAEHDNPVQDVVTVNGDWGVGSHTVQVQMLEDAWGGLPSLDRNLYVESTTYNGAEVPGGSLFLNTTYAQTFAFTDGGTVDLPGADITPTNTTIGSGPDSVVLQISQDQYQGPATYTIMVDGAQIGGVLTAHAEHDNAVQDVVTVNGDWGAGSHTVQVQMLEDAWDGLPSLDRNLYVESTTYNGAEVPGGSLFLNTAYPQTFAFTDGATVDVPAGDTTPTNTTIGSGPDSLVLQISQDQYQGPATYTIMVDGAQIGGVLTAHAEHDNPVQDVVTVNGDWGVGSHTVQVQMLEDAWGGLPSLDRNLYVESTTYNGAQVPGGSLFLNTAYPQTFAFTDSGANAGLREADTGVSILVDGTTPGTTMADITGAWAFTPSSTRIGADAFNTIETDLAGNSGPGTVNFTLDTAMLFGVA